VHLTVCPVKDYALAVHVLRHSFRDGSTFGTNDTLTSLLVRGGNVRRRRCCCFGVQIDEKWDRWDLGACAIVWLTNCKIWSITSVKESNWSGYRTFLDQNNSSTKKGCTCCWRMMKPHRAHRMSLIYWSHQSISRVFLGLMKMHNVLHAIPVVTSRTLA